MIALKSDVLNIILRSIETVNVSRYSNKLLIFALFFVLFYLPIQARNFYVSTTGDDENPGTRRAPKASIKEASLLLQSGDTLFIMAGVYALSENNILQLNGTKDKWIVIMAYPGNEVYLDAAGVDNVYFSKKKNGFENLGIITISQSSYLRISDITIVNSHNIGFLIQEPEAHHIDIIRCTSDKSYSSGIAVWYADSVNILSCKVSNANDQMYRPQGAPINDIAPNEAISLVGATNFLVQNNTLLNCHTDGIACREVVSGGRIINNTIKNISNRGIYLNAMFGIMEELDIHSNSITQCNWGIALGVEGESSGIKNIRVHHNIIFKTFGSGFILGTWGNNGHRTHIFFYNNTVYACGSENHPAGETGGIDLRSNNISDIYIVNNISYKNYAFEIATFNNVFKSPQRLSSFNILIIRNLVNELEPIKEKKGNMPSVYSYLGEDFIVDHPKFTDPELENFTLKEGSPALGAANHSLPFDTGDDLGAVSGTFNIH